jgi:hypothetical protein
MWSEHRSCCIKESISRDKQALLGTQEQMDVHLIVKNKQEHTATRNNIQNPVRSRRRALTEHHEYF